MAEFLHKDHSFEDVDEDLKHNSREFELTGAHYEAPKADMDIQLARLSDEQDAEVEHTIPDRDFKLHGPEDEGKINTWTGKDAGALKMQKQEEARADLNTAEEERLAKRSAINTLEGFNDRPEINTAKDEKLSELKERVAGYVEMTGKDSLINKDYNILSDYNLDDAMERLEDINRACNDYIENSKPFFRPGRKRRTLVMELKEEVAELKDDREGLEKCYEDIYIRFDPENRDNDSADGEDDDNRGKKLNETAEVDLFVRTNKWPVKMVDEADTKRTDVTGRKNNTVLTADKRHDETRLSNKTRQEITMVRTIGLLFGISDWQQISDPEELLYRENVSEPEDITIDLGGIKGGALATKMSEEEGRRLASSIKGDPEALQLIHALLSDGGRSVKKIASITGVPVKILKDRARTLKKFLVELRTELPQKA